jgi:hypothetical protein
MKVLLILILSIPFVTGQIKNKVTVNGQIASIQGT